jgi:Uma2 family endonuclease
MSVTVSPPAEERVYLYEVPWALYVSLNKVSQGRRTRMAYNRGVIEIMSPGRRHESAKVLISRMIERWTKHHQIAICSTGSTTFRRADEERGFEADESFYIRNEASVRDADEIDLAVSPPPDLILEIDITHRSMSKFSVYESIGVPELWMYDGHQVVVHCRSESGGYLCVDQSRALPDFPLGRVHQIIERSKDVGEHLAIAEFEMFIGAS